MNLKTSEKSFKKENMNVIVMFIVASLAVMVIHYCNWFEQKSQGIFKGRSNEFKTSISQRLCRV